MSKRVGLLLTKRVVDAADPGMAATTFGTASYRGSVSGLRRAVPRPSSFATGPRAAAARRPSASLQWVATVH